MSLNKQWVDSAVSCASLWSNKTNHKGKLLTWLFQALTNDSMSEGSDFLLCIKIASAPALR